MLARCFTKVLSLLLMLLPISAEALIFKPAPESFVEGCVLSIPDLNFYVEAPNSEWDWLVASGTQGEGKNKLHLFSCSLYGLREISFTVSDPYWVRPTLESTSRIMNGVIAEFEKEGFVTTVSEPKPSNIPLPGSYRFQIVGENNLGARRYIYGYYATRGRAYAFMQRSVEDSEPAEFTNFVNSFKLVGKPPRVQLDGVVATHRNLAIAIIILVGSVGWVINKASGRVVFNQWNVALVMLLFAGFGLTVFWTPKFPDPESVGAFIGGSIFVPFFLPVLFALWRSRVLEKRKATEFGRSVPAELNSQK